MEKKKKSRFFDEDLENVTDADLREKLEEILDLDTELRDEDEDFITRVCFRGPFKLSFGQRRFAMILLSKYLGGNKK